MNQQLIIVQQAAGVVSVELNRPERHNALSFDLLLQFESALETIRWTRGVRALVLASTGGGSFCAGGDIREMASMSEDDARSYISLGKRCAHALESLPVPTIAALHGSAFGGGLEIALACDLIVAANTASLGLPEVTLGIIPGFGGIPRLVRRVGSARARWMVITGEAISSQNALDWGLVNTVSDAGAVRSVATAWAKGFEIESSSAVAAAKLALADAADLNLDGGLRAETEHFMSAFFAPDRAEGLRAFVDRRSPRFAGPT